MEAVRSGTMLYKMRADQLQKNISVTKGKITGILLHVTGYEGFSSDPAEQEGNYLALSLGAKEGAVIRTQLIGGIHEEVNVTDGFCVYRVTSPSTQSIRVIFTKGDTVDTQNYSLSGLVCNKE